MEREKIRERTSRGKAARVADGKYPAVGRPPYGYRLDPQRPQPGADDACLLDADSAPTAKTLSARAVRADPHSGHFTLISFDIDRCNCSNFVSHALHWYS